MTAAAGHSRINHGSKSNAASLMLKNDDGAHFQVATCLVENGNIEAVLRNVAAALHE